MRIMRFLADFVYLAAGLLYLPWALYNALVRGKNRTGWKQRFGSVPPRPAGGPRIWIHAVSLGEVNATPRLVAMLRDACPALDVVISTTTDTGFQRAVHHYGVENVFRAPLDFSFVVARVLRRIKPDMLVLVEQELWFNQIRMAHARGIPVAVVNGRMTERSAGRYALLRSFVRGVFARISWIGAQDEPMASRFIDLGAKPDAVKVVPSLKWDSADLADSVPGSAELASSLGLDKAGTPIWVCGSTGVGEDAIILEAYRRWQESWGRRPRLVIVPRRPETFDKVADAVTEAGFDLIRRSAPPDDLASLPDAVILGDTMGELRAFYSLADVVFVGRSLVKAGGSDPMEVAGLGHGMIVGPHTSNFREPVRLLVEAGAIEVVQDGDSLIEAGRRFAGNPERTAAVGRTAQETVRRQQGGTRRTADALLALLRPTGQHRQSDG